MSKKFTDTIVQQYKLLRHQVSGNSAARLMASLLLVVGLFAGAYLVEQGYRYFTQADTDPVDLYFAPETQNLPPNSSFSLMLDAKTNSIGFVDVQFTFDPSKVRLASEITTAPELATVVQRTTMNQANSTGQVDIVLGLSPGSPAPTGIFDIAMFDLTAVSNTDNDTASLNYVNANSQIVAQILDAGGNPIGQEAAVINSRPASLTLNATSTSGPKLHFSNPTPANPQSVNSNFTINVLMDTDGQNVSGFDAIVNYDSTVLTAVNATQGSVSQFVSYPSLDVTTPGTVVISGNVGASSSTSVNGTDLHVGTITFRPTATSAGTDLNYDFTAGSRNDSNIVLSGSPDGDPQDILASVESSTITVTTGPTTVPTPTTAPTTPPTPTVTPTAGPGQTATPTSTPTTPPTPVATATSTPTSVPNTSVNLNMQFQGLTRSGVNRTKQVTLQRRSATGTVYPNITATTDSTGRLTVSIPAGNYIFLADTPGYLAKRYGTFTSPISITDLTTAFTYPLMLGGDFNSDGIVNEVDYTLHFLPNYRGTSSLVDLDGSGEVNNLDFEAMRSSWGFEDDIFE